MAYTIDNSPLLEDIDNLDDRNRVHELRKTASSAAGGTANYESALCKVPLFTNSSIVHS